jgi:hypothetical protein
MQKQNWRSFNRVVVVAMVALVAVSFTTLAVAQRVDAHAILAAAPKINTSVQGVHAFPAPPSDFNPLTASNHDLVTYGLPQRPDEVANPKDFEHWKLGMSALQACFQRSQSSGATTSAAAQTCHATDVKAQPYSSRPMAPATKAAVANVDGTTAYNSYNWSGIAQTNKLTKWNANTSFDEVASVWNVPVANHPFGNIPCSDGPWWEVTWNGIDGFDNGDVVQGGSSSFWDGGGCKGAIETYGWVEWYPSYSILTITCSGNPCFVSPGDDFYVITYAYPGFDEQYVFVEDITQQWSGTFGLTYQSGPGVVGSSAEYIVERPCCNGDNYYPLGNYVYEFFDYSFAYDGKGTIFYPGSAASSTAIVTMIADDGSTDISRPFWYGTAGNQGRYSIWMADENCAESGGCTP